MRPAATARRMLGNRSKKKHRLRRLAGQNRRQTGNVVQHKAILRHRAPECGWAKHLAEHFRSQHWSCNLTPERLIGEDMPPLTWARGSSTSVKNRSAGSNAFSAGARYWSNRRSFSQARILRSAADKLHVRQDSANRQKLIGRAPPRRNIMSCHLLLSDRSGGLPPRNQSTHCRDTARPIGSD